MTVFAKVRQGFAVIVGEVTHEAGVILALTEREFAAVAHMVEDVAEDVARALHLTKGHAIAISPEAAKTVAPSAAPAPSAAVEATAQAATPSAAPAPEPATPPAAETGAKPS